MTGGLAEDEEAASTRSRTWGEADERERSARTLQLLEWLIVENSRAETVKEALYCTLWLIGNEIGWEVGQAWLPTADGNRLEFACGWYAGLERASAFEQTSRGLTFTRGDGIVGGAWAEGAAVCVADISSERGSRRAEVALEVGLRGAVAVPVLAVGETVAVVEFLRTETYDAGDGVPGLLTTVAAQIGALFQAKQATERYARSEASLKDAQRLSKVGSWEWDVATDEVIWSEELYRIFGLGAGEFDHTYGSVLANVHPDDTELFRRTVREACETRQPFSFLHRIVRPDGDVRVAHARGDVQVRDGEVVRMTGTSQDVTERVQSGAALRASEEQFRALAETAGDAIITADASGAITYFSAGAEQIFDVTRAAMIGQPLSVLIPARYVRRHQEGFARALETGEMRTARQQRELSGVRGDGSEFPLELSLTCWGVGASRAFGAVIRDITERKEGERALRRIARQLGDAQGVAGLGWWELDVGSGELTWSDELYRIAGRTRADFTPTVESSLACVHPDDLEAMRGRLFDGPVAAVYEAEFRVVRPDGTVRTVLERGSAVAEGDSPPTRVIGTVLDISERKADEELIRHLHRQNELILHSAGEGICGMDTEGYAIFMNEAATRMLGWTLEEMSGRTMHDVIHHSREDGTPLPLEKCRAMRAVRSGQRSVADDEVFWRRDGSCFPVEYIATPIEQDGAVLGGVVTFRDVTERVEITRERAAFEARLRQGERLESIGKLAGGIAHDFNNLLAVILNYADFLHADLPPDSELRGYVDEIGDAARRAADLTRQLLRFSRREQVRMEVLDLNATVAETERMLVRTLGEHVTVAMRLADEPLPVEGDRSQLQMVLLNLAVNARDAMPSGGTLTIEVDRIAAEGTGDRGLAVLRVTDDGCGMDEEARRCAFDPFFTTKPPGQGTGLGLATVYGVVKQARGEVELQSTLGVGTEVKVLLPVSDRPFSEPVEPPPAHDRQRGHATVMVVEDEDPVRHVACRILNDHGYTVIEAADGEQALRLIEDADHPVDLLLTDVVMPGMSGTELVEAIAVRDPRTRVLFMSGYSDDLIARHGVAVGAQPLVHKPFQAEDLIAAVSEVMSRPTTARGGDPADVPN